MENRNENIKVLKEEWAGDAEALRAKVGHYIVCFHDGCEHHARCLRWVVGLHAEDDGVALLTVNPRCPEVLSGRCSLYRPCEKVVMKRGLMHFFDGMTSRQERQIRQLLIDRFNRKVYYQMRKGQHLIAPDEQHDIEAACRQCGWTGPFNYDGETEDFVW